ncbi:MAG TPA: hypothetical protein VFK47_03430 [Ktedonobacteraceae bacterium]|nr:hypothetical protein [Ktedonobacteraceae bacterium]
MDEENIYRMANGSHGEVHEIIDPLVAGMVGSYIGAKLDQTRFGIWYNTNKTVTAIYKFMQIAAILFAIYCVGLFFYYVITL